MRLHSRTDRAYRSGVLRRVRLNAAHISGADGGRASGGVLYPACPLVPTNGRCALGASHPFRPALYGGVRGRS